MATIDEVGFLSENINFWIQKHRTENIKYFNVVEELNRLSQDILLKIDITGNTQELLVTALFTRILSTFQSIVFLSERGMISESNILLRTMMERMFELIAITKDKNLIVEFYHKSQREKIKHLNKLVDYNPDVRQDRNYVDLLKWKDSTKEELDSLKSGFLTIKEWSKRADKHELYLHVYTKLSESVHASFFDLINQYYQIDNTNTILSAKWGPNVKGIDIILKTAITIIYNVLLSLIEFFNLKRIEELTKIIEPFGITILNETKNEKNN